MSGVERTERLLPFAGKHVRLGHGDAIATNELLRLNSLCSGT